MDSWWHLAWPISLVLLGVGAWLANFISLPGNWIAALLVVGYFFWGPQDQTISLGRWETIAAIAFASVGEILEFAASALGTQKAGASRRAMVLSIVGSMLGALVGATVGLPIPVMGSVIAAILFGALGATAGAVMGEWMTGKTLRETVPVGHAAFWGRLLGTLGKLIAGAMILLVIILGVCF